MKINLDYATFRKICSECNGAGVHVDEIPVLVCCGRYEECCNNPSEDVQLNYQMCMWCHSWNTVEKYINAKELKILIKGFRLIRELTHARIIDLRL